MKRPGREAALLVGVARQRQARWEAEDSLAELGELARSAGARVVETVSGMSSAFLLMIAVFYGGELVWRERDRKMNELSLATRLPAAQLAVLTALNVADDMLKAHDENNRLKRELAQALAQVDGMKAKLKLKGVQV